MSYCRAEQTGGDFLLKKNVLGEDSSQFSRAADRAMQERIIFCFLAMQFYVSVLHQDDEHIIRTHWLFLMLIIGTGIE